MYECFALIAPQSNFSWDGLDREFRKRLAGLHIVRSGTRLKLGDGAWELKLLMNDAPAVLQESQEMARRFGEGRADRDVIATCATRLEIQGGADPRMNHCNDYILALECLEVFTGVFLFDANGQEWI
jgi:hypothetical protein